MPVVFEQVFAEKPAGGVIPNPAHDIMPGTALDASGKPIKAYRLTKAVGSSDTTIQIEKGSGIASGDIIGHGKKAVASTKVDTSNPVSYTHLDVYKRQNLYCRFRQPSYPSG